MPDIQELKDHLLKIDPNFRQLVSEHHELDVKIQHLTHQSFLSPPQQVEEVSLKKQKLKLKDQIEERIRQHAHNGH